MFWSWDTVGNLLDVPKKRFMEKMEFSKRKVVIICRQYIRSSFKLAHTARQSSISIPSILNCENLGLVYESCFHVFNRFYVTFLLVFQESDVIMIN